MEKFNLRVGNLEVRSCNNSLLSSEPHTTAEIVKWNNDNLKPFCYTLAFWHKTKDEGYELRFVLDRPFAVDTKTFMQLAKWGQEHLTDYEGTN